MDATNRDQFRSSGNGDQEGSDVPTSGRWARSSNLRSSRTRRATGSARAAQHRAGHAHASGGGSAPPTGAGLIAHEGAARAHSSFSFRNPKQIARSSIPPSQHRIAAQLRVNVAPLRVALLHAVNPSARFIVELDCAAFRKEDRYEYILPMLRCLFVAPKSRGVEALHSAQNSEAAREHPLHVDRDVLADFLEQLVIHDRLVGAVSVLA